MRGYYLVKDALDGYVRDDLWMLDIIGRGVDDAGGQDLRYMRQLRESVLEISRTLGSTEMASEMAATM